MKLKSSAFVWNVTVGGTSNCDWGAELDQSNKHTLFKDGSPDIITAMLYYKIENTNDLKVVLGKGSSTPQNFNYYKDKELILASCFKKVFLNGKKLEGQEFVMFIVKETNKLNSKHEINVHYGRCTLKFSNSLLYKNIKVNQNCIDAISKAFNQSPDGSWAILEMEIKQDDELHFTGFPLGNKKKDYSSIMARNTDFNEKFENIIPLENDNIEKLPDHINLQSQQYKYIAAIKTKPFLILGGFSGTGKSQQVKELAFATCPCDGVLNTLETTPGNYLLVSVKPNWHDATDIIGFRSSINNNYYVTDFMRFLVKAKSYENEKIPFFVCLDEMNLAPVEEYFADFLSVIESRKRTKDGKIVTDPLIPASVFNDKYADDFNIFMSLGLKLTNEEWKADEINALSKADQDEAFIRQDIVDDLRKNGLTIPQNLIIIGTVNMDDTTNTFSRKVIDRAMTFETIISTFGIDYYDNDVSLHYIKNPKPKELFVSDEVCATDMIKDSRSQITDDEKQEIINFINGINQDMEGTPFKISYRILNETILLYHAKIEIKRIMEGRFEDGVIFNTDLNQVFDDIIMQKVLPRIEGDYDKCNNCLIKLSTRAVEKDWKQSAEKIEFMIKRFGRDKSGFTSFWN